MTRKNFIDFFKKVNYTIHCETKLILMYEKRSVFLQGLYPFINIHSEEFDKMQIPSECIESFLVHLFCFAANRSLCFGADFGRRIFYF